MKDIYTIFKQILHFCAAFGINTIVDLTPFNILTLFNAVLSTCCTTMYKRQCKTISNTYVYIYKVYTCHSAVGVLSGYADAGL